MKLLLTLLLFSMPTFAHDHLITVKSQHSVEDTANKFVNLVKEKGLRLFTRINHKENASAVDLELNPTEVILFGNPLAGTSLMNCSASVAIDLPQKVLIREDENGRVFLSYANPAFMKELHAIEGCDPVLEKITGLLANLAEAATH